MPLPHHACLEARAALHVGTVSPPSSVEWVARPHVIVPWLMSWREPAKDWSVAGKDLISDWVTVAPSQPDLPE